MGEDMRGPITFTPLPSGREAATIGSVQVGEIGPVHDPRSRFPICFRVYLPQSAAAAWRPARDEADARRQLSEHVNDWLNAADLRPNIS